MLEKLSVLEEFSFFSWSLLKALGAPSKDQRWILFILLCSHFSNTGTIGQRCHLLSKSPKLPLNYFQLFASVNTKFILQDSNLIFLNVLSFNHVSPKGKQRTLKPLTHFVSPSRPASHSFSHKAPRHGWERQEWTGACPGACSAGVWDVAPALT